MNTSNQPETTGASVPVFSVEKTKAEIGLSLTRDGLIYQSVLQECENVVFTEDNIADEELIGKLKRLRVVKKKIEDMENPYTPMWKGYNDAKKSMVAPLEELISRKESQYRDIHKRVEEKNRALAAEKERVDGIRAAMDAFVLDQSQAVAAATTTEQIVAIEKIIGSHKANSSRYQEFLPELAQRLDNLTPFIKSQKEAIKKLTALKGKEMAAESTGDDMGVLEARGEQEVISGRISEIREIVQEKAIEQATSSPIMAVPVKTPTGKARLTKWKAEIVDKKVAMAKSAELLDVSLNHEKITASIKTLKDSGVFSGKTEHIVNGIRYYEEKSFL